MTAQSPLGHFLSGDSAFSSKMTWLVNPYELEALPVPTTLAEMGSPPSLILEAIGRWTSESFRIYVRKNPVIIQAMLFARRRDATLCPSP